jgi:glycosyltransferase involved in cell wall biosynthesis
VPVESTADTLREMGIQTPITIWGRGVDRDQFNPKRRNIAWRKQHGIKDDEVAIVFLGRLVLEKGLDVFAEVLTLVQKQHKNVRPLIIGDGPARKHFESHLKNGVFVGFKVGNDLGEALASGDVLFNPSETEAFGNVTQEAFSCGLPVVAAAATGATNLIEDGVSGKLVKPGDFAGYAKALSDYVADPKMRAAHSKAGIAFAKTRQWDEINNTVLKAYEELVDQNIQQKAV